MSTIITRNSATSGSTPSSLVQGELAINVTDGRLFYGSGSGNIVKEFTGSASGGTIDTGSFVTTSSFNAYTGSNTSQFAGTASYATTASYALNALSASYALTASFITASNVYGPFGSNSIVSASYAATASYATTTSDILVLVKNQTGDTIAKGVVVRITGSNTSSDIPRIVTASYENDNNSANTLGITNQSIANGDDGYVMTEGILLGIDTNAFISGQLIYLGATGSIIGYAPQAPLHNVRLGEVVRQQSNNGSIYVRIDNGYELEELHDVRITSASSGDLLIRSASVWINSKQLSGSYGLTGSLTATSFTGSLFGTSSWANNAQTSQTSSYVLNAISASYSQTASYLNTLNQDLTFNGNLTLNGTASISFLNVAYESASVIYSSGSNQFGDASNDVQTLWGTVDVKTGPVLVTGSLNVSGGITGSLLGTSSYAVQSLSSSYAQTASYVQNAQTASYVLNAVSSSYASNALSASYAVTSSYSNNSTSASYAINSTTAQTASYVLNAVSASYATTASYYGGSVISASYAATASYVQNAQTASYVLNAISSSYALSASYSTTSSYSNNSTSASYAINATTSQTASYVLNAISASYATQALSSSFSSTASYYGGNVVSASYATTASYVQNAISASYATNASSASVLDLYSITSNTNSYLLFSNTIAATGQIVGGDNDLRYNSSTNTLTAVNISASSLTGSLFGTASYATQAITAQTASYVINSISSSYAQTASYVLNAISSSYTTQALSSSYSITASYSTLAQTASYVLQAVSASYAATASYVQTAQTASYVQNAQTASYVLNAISASYALNATTAQTASYVQNAQTASYVLNAQTASYIQTAQTASYVLNAVSASYVTQALSSSFASTASYVNPLNQNVLITGSATIGSSSLGPFENTITLGARDSANEGGQIGFNAPGGTYTSASFIDNWSNYARILRGTNASSTGLVAQWNLHTLQMQLPAYTNASSFPGTATANLAIDSGGNIITVSTTGGSVFPYVGDAVITGSLTTTGIIYAQPNGGMYFQGGDDAALYDINVANTMGIYGMQTVTEGAIKLGSNGPVLYGSGSRLGLGTTTPTSASLTVNGNVWANSFTGSLQGTSSYATQALSASYALSATTANTASYVQNAQTASYVQTAQTASYVLNAISSSYALSASFSVSSSRAVSASFATTASYYGGSVISASYAATASYVNPLIQNVIVTGSLDISGSFIAYDESNVKAIQANLSKRSLFDTSAVVSVNWSGRGLYTPSSILAIDWSDNNYLDSNVYQRDYKSATTQNAVSNTINNAYSSYLGDIIEVDGVNTIINGTVNDGMLVYLDTDATWYPVNQSSTTATKMIGIACNVAGPTGFILLEGHVVIDDSGANRPTVTGADHGLPVYIEDSTTNGRMSTTLPTTAGGNNVIRVVGHCYWNNTGTSSQWMMKFRPSNDWITI